MNDSSDAQGVRSAVPHQILETVVYCADLAAARTFYETVIGLSLVSEEPNRHLFFRVGRGMLLVFRPQSTRHATVHVDGQIIPRHGSDEPTHFAFAVEPAQLPLIKKRLEHHGVAIESEISWPSGGHSLYCRDPSQNSVEFATPDLWFSTSAVDGSG